jgi:very-short-patch-repair endonuclease
LIVELDGGQHADRREDGRRDSELCALGYRVIRFWNSWLSRDPLLEQRRDR